MTNPIYAPPIVAATTTPKQQPLASREVPLEFTGDAGEYFRIWIVNLLLSVVTFGIYSAWAKVRTKQYFYRHTSIDGFSFDYLADPLRILKGRILIAVALGVVALCQYSPVAYAISLVLLVLSTPWVLVKALSFNARNSSFRNVRFVFQGTVGESYGVYLTCVLVQVLTLGMGSPYVNFRQHKFMAERHCYGAERFLYNRTSSEYFRVYVRSILISLPILIGFVLAIVMIGMGADNKNPTLFILLILPFYAALLAPSAYLRAGLTNLLFDDLKVGPHTLRCHQRMRDLLRLYVENILALAFTLGLAFPWVRIRMARYKASAMKLVISGTLDVMALPGAGEPGAYGEAASDLGDFDFDVG